MIRDGDEFELGQILLLGVEIILLAALLGAAAGVIITGAGLQTLELRPKKVC